MNFFFDIKSKRQLAVTLKFLPKFDVKKVYAAIAYSHDEILLTTCIKNGIHLEWFGLFDARNSTDYELVKKAISSSYCQFYPFASLFHPKVIYFENYGIYIGSANMTHKALYDNVEAGIFIEEKDLMVDDKKEIMDFFDILRKKSVPATIDDIQQIENFLQSTEIDREDIESINAKIEDNFKECLGHLFHLKSGVQDFEVTKEDKTSKRKLHFMKEWRETQNYLEIVKNNIIENCRQPSWVSPNADPTIITDQLLHAFYYSYVHKGKNEHKSRENINEYFNRFKNNPEKGIEKAIQWWETLSNAPSKEDIHINQWGIENKKLLGNLQNRDLTLAELTVIMKQNHAAQNHARQIRNTFFDLDENFHTNQDKRTEIYAKWLFNQKSREGNNISSIIRYILFSNEPILEERIYNVLNLDKYKIEHFGKSIIGELVGWGRPDITHLRNNRVNKGLRCLGYNVRLFSD